MILYKYQGTGNDFILFDNRLASLALSEESIAFLCHRRFGIGADGYISIEVREGFDFEMKYYNSDGKPGSMCGNGGRCAVAFAHTMGICKENTLFYAYDGPHRAEILAYNEHEHIISLHMKSVDLVQQQQDYYLINTGSPHYVCFRPSVDSLDVFKEGRDIRYSEGFREEGVNVNFVEITGDQHLFVRTYERGVENETLSCGTGVTASAIAAYLHLNKTPLPLHINTPGGQLQVRFTPRGETFQDIILEGPACQVCRIEIELPLC